MKVTRRPASDPPDAGNGLFAIDEIPALSIIAIYTGGERLSSRQVKKATYKSDYVVQVQHLIRDGYDKKKIALTCNLACINDCMDPSKAYCEWYVHPDFLQLLLVVSIRSIAADEQLFILYGPDYWCQDRFPIAILLAAVIGYIIDIDKSPEWRKLRSYRELRKALADHLAKRQSSMSTTSQFSTTCMLSGSQQSESSSEKVRCPAKSQYDVSAQKQIDIESYNHVYSIGWHKPVRGRIRIRPAAEHGKLTKGHSTEHVTTSRNYSKRSQCDIPNTGQSYSTRKKVKAHCIRYYIRARHSPCTVYLSVFYNWQFDIEQQEEEERTSNGI